MYRLGRNWKNYRKDGMKKRSFENFLVKFRDGFAHAGWPSFINWEEIEEWKIEEGIFS